MATLISLIVEATGINLHGVQKLLNNEQGGWNKPGGRDSFGKSINVEKIKINGHVIR